MMPTYQERLDQWEREWEPMPKFLWTKNGLRDITGKYGTKDQRKSWLKEKKEMSNLILHCGSERVSRSDLKDVLTPVPTSTHKPVPHIQIAELICHEAQHRGYAITSEEYGLNPTGSKMFGVLRFHPEGNPEYSRALGLRNSHDKSMSVGLTVGLSVLVCDNMCFGGESTIRRKHTSGIEIEELIPQAFENLEHQFIRLERDVDGLKIQSISVSGAKLLTVKAADFGVINSSDIIPVLNEFRTPRHEEFADKNRWSLYNSFTEVAKKYTPARSNQFYRGIGKLFELS
jgi:uncharacterized protein DUF932